MLARQFAANTASYVLDYSSFPSAIAIVRKMSAKFLTDQKPQCSDQDAIMLCVGLSVYFGVPWSDLLFARLARIGEQSETLDSPFEISSDSLIIQPGHPYYPLGAGAFDETTVKLPLLPELSALATRLVSVAKPGDSLHILIGQNPSDRIRKYIQRVCNPLKTSRRDLASGLHLPFVTLAIDQLGESPTVVSLLRCNSLPMLRGECAYLVESKQLITATLIRIQNAIRSFAELSPISLENPYQGNDERAGSLQLYPAEFYARLKRKIELADDLNKIMACTELVLRGLGKRPIGVHLNPATILTNFPVTHLVFADKLVSGVYRQRFIPVFGCLADLIRATKSVLGSSESLSYLYDNSFHAFADLPHAEQARLDDSILRDERRHCGRSAFYNALRGAGASQLVLNFACGHGATVTQWNGSLGLRSPRTLLEELKSFTQGVFTDFQLAPSILLLANKLDNLPKKKAYSCLPKPQIIDQAIRERISPLHSTAISELEMDLHSQAINRLASKELRPTAAHLLIAVALEVGLPPENLIRFPYTSDLFVLSGDYVFAKAFVWHSDYGGMSLMPLRLCKNSEGDRFGSTRILSARMDSRETAVTARWRCTSDAQRNHMRNLVGRSFLNLIRPPRFIRDRLTGTDDGRCYAGYLNRLVSGILEARYRPL